MADTQKTWAQIQTLLADNTTGAISPQDLRDAIYSLVPSYGGVYFNGGSTVTSITQNVWSIANANSSASSTNLRQFTTASTGIMTYTGTVDIHAHVVCTVSFSCAVAASKEIRVGIDKNSSGTPIAGSILSANTNGNTTLISVASHTDVMLSQNDTLECVVTNVTDSSNITVQDLYLFAMGMIVTS